MKIVFMGTPDFAVPTLNKLIEHHEVAAVFTQPDRPKGRGQKLQYSPVKEEALKHNIPVYQPIKLKKDIEVINLLKDINPDTIVVVAFGQILPREVLEIPRYRCVNVHASLLPELRGAAPINWSIIRGNDKTGVTTMLMNEGVDTGDILLKSEIVINKNDTYEEIHDKLMNIGANLLIETLSRIEKGNITPEKQQDEDSSYAPMLNKELGHIKWANDSFEIYNLIRGITPWPGAHTFYKGNMIKIWKAEYKSQGLYSKPGEIINLSKEGIEVACSRGSILIKELQEFGSKRMDTIAYLNGHDIEKGITLD
ncbi:MAG: methionyl-tRNA formyltransferase [Clostridiales bacterium]|jgi:methionyl-tRNA formyltransferase|nr:methionyl-tRNA formyltransferase [Clostridiales bacterium]